MENFIKQLLEWISDVTGLNNALSATFSAVIVALLVWVIQSVVKSILAWLKATKMAKDLKPHFDYQSVQKATKYFIPTHYQNASPSRQEEPGFTHKYIARNPMIPFFLKIAFNEKKENEKFYLVLADSGMGKTTFMINLYIKYYSFFNWRRKYQMKLFRLGNPNTLNHIKIIKLEKAKNTILLLDALDEDAQILSKDPGVTDEQAFKDRVDEIIEATGNFCNVVITCRTQYFPGQEADPYEIKLTRPDGKGFYILNKLYLSPFTNNEVKQYLNKKFGRFYPWNWNKKKRAFKLVYKAKHLVVRPMLLSYIDYLLNEKLAEYTNFEIYEKLIENWFKREAEKWQQISNRTTFVKNLRRSSRQIALTIYENWQREQRLFLTKNEISIISEENDIDLNPLEVTGQSLLTCNANRDWKFTHGSIFEFFLAKEAIENLNFLAKMNFSGMDMAASFYEENGSFIKVDGGQFNYGDNLHEVQISTFWISKFLITQSEYQSVVRENPSEFKGNLNNPIENISWWNAIQFCNLLNLRFGFQKVYDEQGNLLDNEMEITQNISNVIGFRLPTEAEWEFAAQGGNHSERHEYSGSHNLKNVGWYWDNSKAKTHPVGRLKPNELGIYDMSGNLWEWCYDEFANLIEPNSQNPIVWNGGSGKRVLRGGSWGNDAEECRMICRSGNYPDVSLNSIGFRVVFVPQL